MPPRLKSNLLLWVLLGSAGVLGLCLAACVGALLLLGGGKGLPAMPGSGGAALDPDDVDRTRAWAEDAVRRLGAADKGAAQAEAARVERDLKEGLLGKRVRWSFPVEAVDEGEVKLDTFFGARAGPFGGDDQRLRGKPTRRLYLRVYFDGDADVVRVGGEVSTADAARLKKGDKITVARTVTEVTLTAHDDRWVSTSSYGDTVDVLEPYCVTVVLVRK